MRELVSPDIIFGEDRNRNQETRGYHGIDQVMQKGELRIGKEYEFHYVSSIEIFRVISYPFLEKGSWWIKVIDKSINLEKTISLADAGVVSYSATGKWNRSWAKKI